MITILPASPETGVYVNANGDVVEDDGVTVPPPFSVMVTLVAPPPKVLPLRVTAAVPQVLPEVAERVTVAGLAQSQLIVKSGPVVVHPEALRTVTVWLPLLTEVKILPGWNGPVSRQYW
jgi:hypothetical protein